MAKFKKGDRVRLIRDSYTDMGGEIGEPKKGDILTITGVGLGFYGNEIYGVAGCYQKGSPNWGNMESYFELVENDTWKNDSSVGIKINKQTIMNKVSNFAKKLISTELSTLIDAGIIDSCTLALTSTGKDKLLETLFEANKQALVEIAKEIIAEQDKK